MTPPFVFCLRILIAVATAAAPHARNTEPGTPLVVRPRSPYCNGEYADDLNALAPHVREAERHPQEPFSYCLRSSAVYECLTYGNDGNVRRARKKTLKHGTGFGYRRQGRDTLLLTNFHVAEWPSVTDDEHPVSGVPNGCKRVSDNLQVVDDEEDSYERDDISLSRVVADPQLDVSIVKANSNELKVSPWRVGRSAALKARNVVEVAGFPLGAFRATNVGKVIAPYDHDEARDYDHVDFVVDALLSAGNSGSPVLAVSCQTGEYELVGIFHSAYTRGAAMNVVIGIDQVRDMMTTLKRGARTAAAPSEPAPPGTRGKLLTDSRLYPEPFFPLGPLPSVIRSRPDGTLLFQVFSEDFPVRAHPLLILEDLPSPGDAPDGGESPHFDGKVYFGNPRGLRGYPFQDLDAEAQQQVMAIREALRHDALAAFEVRDALAEQNSSRERFNELSRLERKVKRTSASRSEVAQLVEELAEKLGPKSSDPVITAREALTPRPTEANHP